MDPLDIPEEGDVEEFAELNVPDIASKDPEERKLARRIRIQKRVDALQRLERVREEGEDAEEKQPEKPTQLQIQLEKSSEVLRQLFLEGEEQVTNIRVANDARAADRREYEIINREKILEQLAQEAALARTMFDEIAAKWENVLKYNDPLNIHDMIQAQKRKFDELVKQKDDAIAMLKMEVKLAETKFNNDQRKQNDDITTLAKRVEKQVSTMRAAHRIELQAIEDVMIQDRKNLSENNDKRWEELYRKREEQELAISANKFAQKDSFEAVVTKVRITHTERVREIKIRLEKDCECLQREFELIKATALANREKMDYNYQILKKRELENIIIKSNQKRRLNKLMDFINGFRKKIKEYTDKTEGEIKKLCQEILGLQKYISGVRAKSLSLSVSNERRYMEVWDLNKKVATGILNKLVTIDRLLHEQQLGLQWEEPAVKLLERKQLPSYIDGYNMLDDIKEKPALSTKMSLYSVGTTETDSPAYKRALFNVLERISERSGFLIEFRLRNILEPLKKAEGDLIKIDNVFSGLGIHKDEDILTMLQYFKPYIRCPICSSTRRRTLEEIGDPSLSDESTSTVIDSEGLEQQEPDALYAVRESDEVVDGILAEVVEPARFAERESGVSKEGECLGPSKVEVRAEHVQQEMETEAFLMPSMEKCYGNHPIYIEPCYVLKAVREFVASNFCTADEKHVNLAQTSAKQTMNMSRLMSQNDVKDYWERFKLVLGPHKMGLWDALWYSLQKYHKILEDRHLLSEKLECAKRHNKELKYLLSSYKEGLQMKPPCEKQGDVMVHSIPTVFSCKNGRGHP